MASFTGLLPHTTISVDNFTQPGASVWFLTHFHSGPIYCSELTKSMVLHKFKINSNQVIALDMFELHCLKLFPSTETSEMVNVRLFPANHCPGSVMYFHTGDFRLCSEMKDHLSYFTSRGISIDCLFLDTTFASNFWEKIPTKEEATNQILEIISKHPNDGQVYIECDMLGTEEILTSIAEKYQTKIHIEENKFRVRKCIPSMSAILTVDENETRFHVCRSGTLGNLSPTKRSMERVMPFVANTTPKSRNFYNQDDRKGTVLRHMKNARAQSVNENSKTPKLAMPEVLLIKPSTQWFGIDQGNILRPLPRKDALTGVWHVLYSIHSSFSEIKELVSLISPNYVINTVDCDLVCASEIKHMAKCSALPIPTIPSSVAPYLAPIQQISIDDVTQRDHEKEAMLKEAKKKKRASARKLEPLDLTQSYWSWRENHRKSKETKERERDVDFKRAHNSKTCKDEPQENPEILTSLKNSEIDSENPLLLGDVRGSQEDESTIEISLESDLEFGGGGGGGGEEEGARSPDLEEKKQVETFDEEESPIISLFGNTPLDAFSACVEDVQGIQSDEASDDLWSVDFLEEYKRMSREAKQTKIPSKTEDKEAKEEAVEVAVLGREGVLVDLGESTASPVEAQKKEVEAVLSADSVEADFVESASTVELDKNIIKKRRKENSPKKWMNKKRERRDKHEDSEEEQKEEIAVEKKGRGRGKRSVGRGRREGEATRGRGKGKKRRLSRVEKETEECTEETEGMNDGNEYDSGGAENLLALLLGGELISSGEPAQDEKEMEGKCVTDEEEGKNVRHEKRRRLDVSVGNEDTGISGFLKRLLCSGDESDNGL